MKTNGLWINGRESRRTKERSCYKRTSKDVNTQPVGNVVHALNSINLLDPAQLENAKVFMLQIMRSKKGGIASVEDGLAVLMRAQDLNLPFSTCLEQVLIFTLLNRYYQRQD